MVMASSVDSIDELPQKVEHLAGRVWAIEALLLTVCKALPQDSASRVRSLFEREIVSLRERLRPMSNHSIALQSFESRVRQISMLLS